MKSLDEEKMVEKLLNKKDSNNIKKDEINNKKLNKENNSSLTVLDNNEEQKEKNSEKYSFNSSIPEYIQGTPIYYNNQLIEEKKEQNETKETKEETNQKNKKERKLSYEGLEKNNSLKENESDSNSNETNEKKYQSGRWTKEEHEKFIEGILKYGNEWRKVQKIIKTRSSTQARSHAQKFFLKLRKEINITTLSDPDKFLELIVNSSDKSKSNFKLTNEQKEKLMTVMRMNLKTEENSNKSGNEGCNYSNNVNEKDESGLDDINEEDDNLAYNKDDEDELNFQKKMSVDIDDVKKKNFILF